MWDKVFGLSVSVGVVVMTLKLLLDIAACNDSEAGYHLHITCRIRLLCLISGQVVLVCGLGVVEAGRGVERNHLGIWLPYIICGLLAVLAGSLLMACITDCRNCMVYHFVWWVGGMAGASLLVFAFAGGLDMLFSLIQLFLFGVLQEKIFSRMYGKADCHAFLVCALAECAMGLGFREYLLHMLLAFLLLAVVQAVRKNIGEKGNLKKPVPFLPYITISFWIILMGDLVYLFKQC